jgi:hypothetical protein
MVCLLITVGHVAGGREDAGEVPGRCRKKCGVAGVVGQGEAPVGRDPGEGRFTDPAQPDLMQPVEADELTEDGGLVLGAGVSQRSMTLPQQSRQALADISVPGVSLRLVDLPGIRDGGLEVICADPFHRERKKRRRQR